MEYDYTFDVIEKILIKRALTDKKYLSIMADIFDMRWFEKNRSGAVVLRVAIGYFKKYNQVPNTQTLKLLCEKYCEKRGGIDMQSINSAMMDIHSLSVDVTSEASEKNIESFIKEKGLYYSISDNVEDITKNGNVDKCLERFDKITKISFRDDNLGSFYFDKDCMDRHWEFIRKPDAKISTGWKSLDRVTNGGILKDGRMLAVFVGKAGLGKSLFLANIATNLLIQDKSVVVISLEMSENVYQMRFDSIISNDNINGLKTTYERSRAKIEEFYSKHPNANLIVKEYPPSTVKSTDIEKYLDRLVENGTKIDAIVIDYLNLMIPNTKKDNMYEAVKQIVEQLRALSYKFNAPVISATQTNREGMKADSVGLENISESTGTSATADLIISLNQSEDDRMNGIINGRVIKNRFGPPGGLIPFRMDPKSLKLTDMAFSEENFDESESDVISHNLPNISSDFDDL